MKINRIFVPKAHETLSDDICTRGKVDTGYTCNYKCHFCYYINNLNDKFKKFDIIKEEIFKLQSSGITEFDLSGGESSIHPDFIQIIKYAKQFGKVSTLSNGSMFQNIDFLRNCQSEGLSEILFSLHGWNAEEHDKIVGHQGAFDKIIKSIYNCKILGIMVRINCTVYDNFKHKQYLKLLTNLSNISQVNFLPINYWRDSKAESVDYKIIGIKLKYMIDHLDCEVNVRYMPLCFMKGYETYVVGIYQHIFDKKDWNIATYDSYDTIVSKENMFKQAHLNRQVFTKTKECIKCKYLYVCDGIEPININNKLSHIPGEKIKDINAF